MHALDPSHPLPVVIPHSPVLLPVCGWKVPAGFPSPAADHTRKRVDLNEHLIRNESATHLFRVKGDSMIDAGIFDGDYVVVRRQQTANNGDIVAALIEGEEDTVKTFKQRNGQVWLFKHKPAYEPINGNEALIMGIVKTVLRKLD